VETHDLYAYAENRFMGARWSIRSAMIFICLMALAFAIARIVWIEPLRRRAQGVARLQPRARLMKRVEYVMSQPVPRDPKNPRAILPLTLPAPKLPTRSEKAWHQLKSILAGGNEVNEEVVAISFLRSSGGATDDDLALIANIPSVEALDLTHCIVERFGTGIKSTNGGAPHVTDAGILKVAKLPFLKKVVASRAQLTDCSCEALSGSQSLETLGADYTAITDAGLLTLAKISSLKTVDLIATSVTDEGAEAFKRLRPDVRLRYSSRPNTCR
jgi:hypothetical protein